jgi:hypothetical protein
MKSFGLVLVLLAFAAGGVAAGYVIAPKHTRELADARTQLAAAQTAARVETDRADGAQKQIDSLTKAKAELEGKLSTAPAPLPAEAQLPALDPALGTVSRCGAALRVRPADKLARAGLVKLAKTLSELPGHSLTVVGPDARVREMVHYIKGMTKLAVTAGRDLEIVIE